MTSNIIQGHMRPLLCQNHSSTYIYGPILMKFFLNSNILKTQFFILNDLKCHFYVMEKSCDIFFTLLSDLITTLTYVFIEKFFLVFILLYRYFSPSHFFSTLKKRKKNHLCTLIPLYIH